MVFFAYGTMVGWTSPAISVLMSPEKSPLVTGPITFEDASWIGSIVCLGCVLGTLTFGFVVSVIGPKRSMYFIALPILVSDLYLKFKGIKTQCLFSTGLLDYDYVRQDSYDDFRCPILGWMGWWSDLRINYFVHR